MSITVKMFRLFKNIIQFKSNLRIVCYHSYNNNSLLELFANKTKQTIIRTPQLLSSSQLQWQCRRCLPSWGPPKPPVDKNEVAARVVKTLGSHDKIDKSILTTSSHFIEDLSLDSLDVIELVMKIEDEFKIEISDVDAEKMLKVSDVIDYCIRVLEEQVDDLQRPSIEYLVGEVDKK